MSSLLLLLKGLDSGPHLYCPVFFILSTLPVLLHDLYKGTAYGIWNNAICNV